IADALVEKGVQVEKRRIELDHPIKSLGVHDVEVRLHRDVTAHLQVEVVPLGSEKLEEAAPVAQQIPPPPLRPSSPRVAGSGAKERLLIGCVEQVPEGRMMGGSYTYTSR